MGGGRERKIRRREGKGIWREGKKGIRREVGERISEKGGRWGGGRERKMRRREGKGIWREGKKGIRREVGERIGEKGGRWGRKGKEDEEEGG